MPGGTASMQLWPHINFCAAPGQEGDAKRAKMAWGVRCPGRGVAAPLPLGHIRPYLVKPKHLAKTQSGPMNRCSKFFRKAGDFFSYTA